MYWNEKDQPVAHFHAYHAGRRASVTADGTVLAGSDPPVRDCLGHIWTRSTTRSNAGTGPAAACLRDRLAPQPLISYPREKCDREWPDGLCGQPFAQVRAGNEAGRQTASGAVCAGSNPAGGAASRTNSNASSLSRPVRRNPVTSENGDTFPILCPACAAPETCPGAGIAWQARPMMTASRPLMLAKAVAPSESPSMLPYG
jgi:hypothetical protein